MATGLAFFGSLGDRANAILGQFSSAGLLIILKFRTGIADATREQVQELDRGQ